MVKNIENVFLKNMINAKDSLIKYVLQFGESSDLKVLAYMVLLNEIWTLFLRGNLRDYNMSRVSRPMIAAMLKRLDHMLSATISNCVLEMVSTDMLSDVLSHADDFLSNYSQYLDEFIFNASRYYGRMEVYNEVMSLLKEVTAVVYREFKDAIHEAFIKLIKKHVYSHRELNNLILALKKLHISIGNSNEVLVSCTSYVKEIEDIIEPSKLCICSEWGKYLCLVPHVLADIDFIKKLEKLECEM